jgi:transcriptional regulator with XRE-family HTH domain
MEIQKAKKLSDTSEISNRFREMIKDQNMTQREFCKKTGISTGHLSKVLTGNAIPSGSMLILIAKEGFDVNFILSGVSQSKILNEQKSEINKLKLIVQELRSIINYNMKQ